MRDVKKIIKVWFVFAFVVFSACRQDHFQGGVTSIFFLTRELYLDF